MAFGLFVCKWRVFRAPLEIGFKRVPRTILAACMLHNWCINQRLRENGNYRVEDDEDLIEGVEEVRVGEEAPVDLSVAQQDMSRIPLSIPVFRPGNRYRGVQPLRVDSQCYC